MAIDTKEKRFSALGFGISGRTLPVARGSFSQGERQHLLGAYSGILFGPPPAPVVAILVVALFWQSTAVNRIWQSTLSTSDLHWQE